MKTPKTKKLNGSRVKGSASVSGAVGAAVIAWTWNGFVPESFPQMGPEVAAAMGALVGPVVAYLVSWLPHPHPEEDGL